MQRTKYLFFLGLSLLILSACNSEKQQENEVTAEPPVVRYEYGLPIDSFRVVENKVGKGEALSKILSKCGASAQTIRQLDTLDKDILDPRVIRQGNTYLAFYNQDSVLCHFVYCKSRIESAVLHTADSTLTAELFKKEIKSERKITHATIESSLWNAMVGAGANPQLALELSEIYAWTIDFFGLQKGDSVIAVYDEQYVDNSSIGIGQIYAAAFTHNGATQFAYYFSEGDTHGYFDEQGKSLRKAFLKAPLNYKRISSTYNPHRLHPIFKTVRPHLGVDYAAPEGTPVVALGDGKVVFKGYKGGGGNTLKVKHNSTYTTGYLHLSRYAKNINNGTQVKQGQVIGYVGQTGHATGPHLDFRVWKNGNPINPLKLESPSVDPVPDKLKSAYDSIVNLYNTSLK